MRGKFFIRAMFILMIAAFLGACTSTVSTVDSADAPNTAARANTQANNPAVRQTPAASTTVTNIIGTRSESRVTTETNRPVIVDAVLDIEVKPLIAGVFIWPFILWVDRQDLVLIPALSSE